MNLVTRWGSFIALLREHSCTHGIKEFNQTWYCQTTIGMAFRKYMVSIYIKLNHNGDETIRILITAFTLTGAKERRNWGKIPSYRPVETRPTTTTTTTTTTRRPIYHPNTHHHDKYPHHPPQYPHNTPQPRDKYPTYYPRNPYKPNYNDRPNYPDRITPDRRHHNTTEDHPRRPTHHYPRPTETTVNPTTHRPRYPSVRPEYPNYRPNHPNDPNRDHPRRKPYYPEKTTAKPTPPSDKPDTCDTSYDAVTMIRGELFIFKNRVRITGSKKYFFRYYPWSSLFINLPINLIFLLSTIGG